jgi:hypothetical protein
MNADLFWIIAAVLIIAALIVQIIVDKRKSQK